MRKKEVLQVKFTVALEHFPGSLNLFASVLLFMLKSATLTFALRKLKTTIPPSRIQEAEIYLTLTWHNIFRYYIPRWTQVFTHIKLNHHCSSHSLFSQPKAADILPVLFQTRLQVKFFSIGEINLWQPYYPNFSLFSKRQKEIQHKN